MADSYPYMISNGKIDSILAKIRSAAKPPKFTQELFKQMGFPSSNDRAAIPLLKKLGFLLEDGTPTEYYDRLKDNTDWQFVLGERIQELYKDIYNINTEIHKAPDDEIRGAISRITGKDENSVNRYLATFKTLASLAKFGSSPRLKEKPLEKDKAPEKEPTKPAQPQSGLGFEFFHNIQIHLPATTDVAVYNAIFKSIRDNLMN